MADNLSLMLEVPEETSRRELVKLLKSYDFSAEREAIPLDRDGVNSVIYIIKGPQTSYEKLEEELKQKGYQLWSNPRMETFGTKEKFE